tara:strand:+ start:1185 stop:1847 length:663 start_codon:yes stop_codon:yes gene_type:complete
LLGSSFYCFGNENLKQATLCAVESPPYSSSYLPNDGPMIELIVNTLNLAGIEVRVRFSSWARSLYDADKGLCLIAGIWPTKERRSRFIFSSKPVVKQVLGLYINSGKNIEEVMGGVLAVERSSYLPKILTQQLWEHYEIVSPIHGVNMLVKSRVDALFAAEGHINFLALENEKLTNQIKLAIPELDTVYGYLASNKDKKGKNIIDAFNNNIEQVLKQVNK